jgi:adenylylsulfate kinase
LSTNIVWHEQKVKNLDRALLKKQNPCLVWFTGLSGSGKSTIANALDFSLYKRGVHTFLLDGDNVRHGLNKDLGFSDSDRVENIRRIGEVSKLFTDAGLIVMSAFISPFASDRNLVRQLFAPGEFIEVFMDAQLSACEQRDPKGLYLKARAGHIKSFTGIDSPYERPDRAELVLDTTVLSVEQCVTKLIECLEHRGFIGLGH